MANVAHRVLCIEDDSDTAAMIAEELGDRGYEVIIARGGEEGLSAIIKEKPDMVLCDVRMPDMSGYEVLERLEEIAPRRRQIPFLFLTGLIEREHELKGRRMGADDYVTKPIDFDRLVLIINARLAGAARARAALKSQELNDREIKVLTEVARGKKSHEIAREFDLSKRTVDFHVNNARLKLRADTRTEAVVKAAAIGLIKL